MITEFKSKAERKLLKRIVITSILFILYAFTMFAVVLIVDYLTK